jgi:hypothetical protein
MKTDKNSRTHSTTSGTPSHPEPTVPDTNQDNTPPLKRARLSYERWLEVYRPVKNTFDANAPYDGYMFETYGRELDFIRNQPPKNIWTLVECDGKIFICEGFHYVNRLGYFTTWVDIPSGFYFSIKAD